MADLRERYYYGAGLSERDTVAGEEIIIVGGANSAGQAAVFFSDHAAKVTILCRSASLSEGMSAYLVDQIAERPNIEVRLRAEVQQVGGTDRLNSITVIDGKSGETDEVKASAMFIFIGASPRTPWLPPQVAKDERGFLLTGPALGDRRFPAPDGLRDPSSMRRVGVFAVGGVRSRSVKRVASAVGKVPRCSSSISFTELRQNRARSESGSRTPIHSA